MSCRRNLFTATFSRHKEWIILRGIMRKGLSWPSLNSNLKTQSRLKSSNPSNPKMSSLRLTRTCQVNPQTVVEWPKIPLRPRAPNLMSLNLHKTFPSHHTWTKRWGMCHKQTPSNPIRAILTRLTSIPSQASSLGDARSKVRRGPNSIPQQLPARLLWMVEITNLTPRRTLTGSSSRWLPTRLEG